MEEPNEAQARALVHAAGLVLVHDLLMLALDAQQQRYYIPPYVISEPKSYGLGIDYVNNDVAFTPQDLTLTFRSTKFGDHELTVNTAALVEEVKAELAAATALDAARFRFFFGGKELVSQARLGLYNLRSGVVVQSVVM